MNKQIVITFTTDGEVTVEAVGFRGCGCEAATKAFEEILGQVGSRKKKPEYDLGRLVVGQQGVRS